MRHTIQVTSVFETFDCPSCGLLFGGPSEFFDRRRQDGKSFYCPNGHAQSFKENEHDRTRRERDRLKQEAARLEEDARAAWEAVRVEEEKRRSAERELKRVRTRAEAGVCPCCNRTFAALARHMKAKHPDVVPLPKKAG